jgi:hypothetical protein
MNILQMAANKIGLPSERVFGDAYTYFEVRICKKKICDLFLDYAYEDTIPEVVEDYCLYILAGRISQQKLLS